MSIAGNFDKAREPECPEVAEIEKIISTEGIFHHVVKTSRAIEDKNACSYFSRILAKMDELRVTPEDQKLIVATISDPEIFGRGFLAKLAADYMAGRVSSEDAVAAWKREIWRPGGPEPSHT